MPEGPEIRIAADRVARIVEGEPLVDVVLTPPGLRRFSGRLRGAKVLRVETAGKAMLTRFDNGLTLYSHNQLYGRWIVQPPGALPETSRSLRVALHTARGSALLYSATDIAVLDEAGVAAHPFLRRIGPDILHPDLHWRSVAARLDEPRFRRRALSGLYLDQGFIAGIGNYLRSEILYFAGLAYARRPVDLETVERNRLARETLALGRRSYRTRGLTNPPARVRQRIEAGDTTWGSHRYAVFDREGLACDACGTAIRRDEAGSRRIYFCPTCQR